MSKHIFITGGVVSSLGKGLTSAAIGVLLESRGLKVSIQKFDPYINVDPGTMSPFQHGEVYVTDDGAETDLDLGHYERFTHAVMTKDCNWTTGMIYNSVISKERRGEYLGSTVQVVPHITNEIKDCVHKLAHDDVDVVITEIGGTVGDIESLPFLEAIRQFSYDVGRENILYVHLTLIPYLHATGESKTKPTQHSVGRLREIGIIPDVLICRTHEPLSAEGKQKISLFCNVEQDCVIDEKDVDYSIYEIPLVLSKQKLDDIIVRKLGLKTNGPSMDHWVKMLDAIKNPEGRVKVAVVGKYIGLASAYESIYEALAHGGIANRVEVVVERVNSEDLDTKTAQELLGDCDGILVPGGFGTRGIEGKIKVVRFARENRIPFFGICLGMQCATIEFARNICGLKGANSSEFDEETSHPVISLMKDQEQVVDMGGTMRLGAYPCKLQKDTAAAQAYDTDMISERHRHRYEFNNDYRESFAQNGMVFAGIWPEGDLVEIVEIADHPWFVGVQFHPEFKSKPTAAHPLFKGFVRAAVARSQQNDDSDSAGSGSSGGESNTKKGTVSTA